MVREQITARGISDPRVIHAMRKVPRHLFVDTGLINRAYDDCALPIGEKQSLSQPYMAARMTQALELTARDRILEIGTGSGYQTALLAELCFNVLSVEKVRALSRRARAVLECLEYRNIALHVGDGTIGWSANAPYSGILVTAAASIPPAPMLEQLADGGRMVIPVGDAQTQCLLKITRRAGEFEQEDLGKCRFVKLIGKYGWLS